MLPQFPAPIYLTTRPDLGDLSRAQLVTLDNFEMLFKDAFNPKQLEGLRLLLTAFPQAQFNTTADRRALRPHTGVACFDCHANGHSNAASHTVGDIRPNDLRHRIGTPSLRGVNIQRLFGSQRAMKSVEDFTEFEQRAAYFDGDPGAATRKGVNVLERGARPAASCAAQAATASTVASSVNATKGRRLAPKPPLRRRASQATAAALAAASAMLAHTAASAGTRDPGGGHTVANNETCICAKANAAKMLASTSTSTSVAHHEWERRPSAPTGRLQPCASRRPRAHWSTFVLRTLVFALGAEAGHRQSLRTVCRLPKAIGLWPMAARRAHGCSRMLRVVPPGGTRAPAADGRARALTADAPGSAPSPAHRRGPHPCWASACRAPPAPGP